MGMTEVLRYIIEGDGTKAISEFRKVGAAAESEITGKTGGALSGLSGIAKAGLAVAGTAIAGFAVKGVESFAELGAEVLKFQRVAGGSAEDASKWIEAFHDYGVSADTAATLVGRFEKAIPAGKLEEFGIQVATNNQGLTDVQGTLLNVADAFVATKDETERARLGSALFGKTWQDVIPLLTQGAEGLKKSFDEVDPGKILSQDDVKRAEEMRLALDQLGDKMQGLAVQAGKTLLPVMEKLVTVLDGVSRLAKFDFGGEHNIEAMKQGLLKQADAADKAKLAATGLLNEHKGLEAADRAATIAAAAHAAQLAEQTAATEKTANMTKVQAAALRDNKDATEAEVSAAKARITVLDEQEATDKAAAKAIAESTKAFEDHNRQLDAGVGAEGRYAQAQLDLVGKAQAEEAAILAAKNAKGLDNTMNLEATASHGALLEAVDNAAHKYAEMTGAVQGSIDYQSRLADSLRHLANSDVPGVSAAVAELIAQLHLLPTEVNTNITVTTNQPGGGISVHPVHLRAGGGAMSMNAQYRVGEGGPEDLVMTPAGPQVIPASAARSNGHSSNGSGTSVVTLNITPPPGQRTAKQYADSTVEALAAYRKRNGRFPWE